MKGVASLIVAAAALAPSATPAAAQAPASAAALVAATVRSASPVERGTVSAVSVEAGAAGAGTAVVVRTDRAVEVQDFTLDAPRRVVLDLAGATLAPGAARVARAEGAAAAGVVGVRASQYRAGIVRVVVELDGQRPYRVERGADGVRVLVGGAAMEQPPVAKAPATYGEPAAERPQPPVRRAPARPAVRDVALRDVPARDVARNPAYEPAPPPAPRRPAGPARLTVTYQEADIRDVISAFAAFSGRTIIVGKEVSGTVSAEIKDQPWDVALAAVLRTQGLAASEDRSGIITVDSWRNLASNRAVEPLVTQIVEVNYAKASSLVPTIQTLLSRDCTMGDAPTGSAAGGAAGQGAGVPRGCLVRGSVTADTATNKLLVTDVPSHLPEIVARLKELDIRTPQVAIKAKIVFVNRTRLEDLGVSYDLGTNQQFFSRLVQRPDPSTAKPVTDPVTGRVIGTQPTGNYTGDRIALGGSALSALANADRALAPSALNLIYSAALGRFQLTAFINALQQTMLADVQSEPSIVTLNNRTANIFVGQQIPIRVIDASAGGGGAGGGGGAQNFPRATVRLEEAGIRLSVTPQVTNNRRIVLSVRAENSNAQVGSSEVGVVFNRQYAENQLLIGDGETAVIGGLTVTERSRQKTGIPFLVELPLVGRFFGQTTTNEVKRDLIILVTPHILDEGEQAPIPVPPRR